MGQWEQAMERAHEFRGYFAVGFNAFEIAEMFRFPPEIVSAILANPGCELVQ